LRPSLDIVLQCTTNPLGIVPRKMNDERAKAQVSTKALLSLETCPATLPRDRIAQVTERRGKETPKPTLSGCRRG
jgi:hypothetical protein